LNDRVFFWPGISSGPISFGVRHFESYVADQPVILRVSTGALFDSNARARPSFCRFNSGSPRCSNGAASPRGPNTFVSCSKADFAPCNVAEVTFREKVVLPLTIEVSESISGSWRLLESEENL
jgi:hypothetical protein